MEGKIMNFSSPLAELAAREGGALLEQNALRKAHEEGYPTAHRSKRFPTVLRQFYQQLDKEYIMSAKDVISELTCCSPDADQDTCPHAYPNIVDSAERSDCLCAMSQDKSKSRMEVAGQALASFYETFGHEIDVEGTFQEGLGKALNHFAGVVHTLLQQKVRGRTHPAPAGLRIHEAASLLEAGASVRTIEAEDADSAQGELPLPTSWSADAETMEAAQAALASGAALLEMGSSQRQRSLQEAGYTPNPLPGLELYNDIRAFGAGYRRARDAHLKAFKRLLVANGPFQAACDAYVAVLTRYAEEVDRSRKSNVLLAPRSEDEVIYNLESKVVDYAIPYNPDVEEHIKFRALLGVQNSDQGYKNMEVDFGHVYRTIRNRFLKCTISLKSALPSFLAAEAAMKPIRTGEPVIQDFTFLGLGQCLDLNGRIPHDPFYGDAKADNYAAGPTLPSEVVQGDPDEIDYDKLITPEACAKSCLEHNSNAPEKWHHNNLESHPTERHCELSCRMQQSAGCFGYVFLEHYDKDNCLIQMRDPCVAWELNSEAQTCRLYFQKVREDWSDQPSDTMCMEKCDGDPQCIGYVFVGLAWETQETEAQCEDSCLQNAECVDYEYQADEDLDNCGLQMSNNVYRTTASDGECDALCKGTDGCFDYVYMGVKDGASPTDNKKAEELDACRLQMRSNCRLRRVQRVVGAEVNVQDEQGPGNSLFPLDGLNTTEEERYFETECWRREDVFMHYKLAREQFREWSRPKVAEANREWDCVRGAINEYSTATNAYIAFLQSEATEVINTQNRWSERMRTLVSTWQGAPIAALLSSLPATPEPEEVALLQSHGHVDMALLRKGGKGSKADAKSPKEVMLAELNARVDEEEFKIVAYAARYIKTRNIHLHALNEVIATMGPYITAAKAYSRAMKSYAQEIYAKVGEILRMRDAQKNSDMIAKASQVVDYAEISAAPSARPEDTEEYRQQNNATYWHTLEAAQKDAESEAARLQMPGSPPYFTKMPPDYWMDKLEYGPVSDIAKDLVEVDYEVGKDKFIECTNAVEESVTAFRKALAAKKGITP